MGGGLCDRSGGGGHGTACDDWQGVVERTGIEEDGGSAAGTTASSGKPSSDARDTMSSSRGW